MAAQCFRTTLSLSVFQGGLAPLVRIQQHTQLNSPNRYLDIWGNLLICTTELKFTWLTPELPVLHVLFTILPLSHTVPQSVR